MKRWPGGQRMSCARRTRRSSICCGGRLRRRDGCRVGRGRFLDGGDRPRPRRTRRRSRHRPGCSPAASACLLPAGERGPVAPFPAPLKAGGRTTTAGEWGPIAPFPAALKAGGRTTTAGERGPVAPFPAPLRTGGGSSGAGRWGPVAPFPAPLKASVLAMFQNRAGAPLAPARGIRAVPRSRTRRGSPPTHSSPLPAALRRLRTRPKAGAPTHRAPAHPGPLLSARPASEDEAVQADQGGLGAQPPRDGTGRGGGGEGIAVTEP
jgi:hypothetical protein